MKIQNLKLFQSLDKQHLFPLLDSNNNKRRFKIFQIWQQNAEKLIKKAEDFKFFSFIKTNRVTIFAGKMKYYLLVKGKRQTSKKEAAKKLVEKLHETLSSTVSFSSRNVSCSS